MREITRDQVLGMAAGRELDSLVAEKVFGWRRIKGPKFDYDGPVESNDVLIPPTIIDEDEAFRMMPPKGAIPFFYFVHRGYSTDIAAAWEVVEKSLKDIKRVTLYKMPGGTWCCKVSDISCYDESAPVAICKAALLTTIQE
jgi:hypothetical protein